MGFPSKVIKTILLAFTVLVPTISAQETTDSLQTQLELHRGIERVPILNELALKLPSPQQELAVTYGREALSILDREPNDSLRVQSLHALGAAFMTSTQYDSALTYGTLSKELAESIRDTSQLIRAFSLMSESHFRQRNYPLSIEYTTQSLNYSTERADSVGISTAALMLGNVHNNLGNYDRSIALYERAAAIRRVRGEEEILARIMMNTGVAYRRKGSYDKALENYFEALSIFEKQNNILRISAILTNLGVLSFYLGEYNDAINYHSRALDLNKELNRKDGIATSLSNLGAVYNQVGRFDEALDNHKQSLAIEQELGDRTGIANGINNIGLVFYNKGNYQQALDQYVESLELKREIGNPESILNSLHNLVDVYDKLGDEPQAFQSANEALALSLEINNVNAIKDSHEKLATLYESAGMYKEALSAFKNFKVAEDSLFNTDTQSVISELQTRFRTKEQEQAILLLQRDQKIQQLWVGGLLGGIALLSAIAFLGYSGYRTKKKALYELDQSHTRLKNTQAQLIQQEKMASLGQLTAGIAHEIKNPLNFVNNFSRINEELIEEVLAQPALPIKEVEEAVHNLKANQSRITLHGDRANKIVESMMQLTHNLAGNKELVDINSLTEEYVKIAQLGSHAQHPSFRVALNEHYDEEAGSTELVPQEIGQVIINVFKNAFDALEEHTEQMVDTFQPQINISTKRTSTSVVIQIADNGPGIPPNIASKIFDPFFTTKEAGKGTGLGLSLSYDIVTQGHGGELTVESEEGMGSIFSVVLPA